MSTVRDLIKDSMMMIGVLASGETPAASESADALRALTRMLESWSLEGLTIYSTSREEFALGAGLASRTMGTGGNFSTTRPVEIQYVNVKVDGVEYPVELLTQAQWVEISDKTQTSDRPTKIYIETGALLATLSFYPVPTADVDVVIHSKKPLTTFTTINETVSFPVGYESAIVPNLSVTLCPMFGKSASGELVQMARDSKANIKRANIKPEVLSCDLGVLGGRSYNIVTGG